MVLNRRFAAKYIRETYKVRCSEKFLAKIASKGEGPPYWNDGDSCWYSTETLRAWINGDLPEASASRGKPSPSYDIN